MHIKGIRILNNVPKLIGPEVYYILSFNSYNADLSSINVSLPPLDSWAKWNKRVI